MFHEAPQPGLHNRCIHAAHPPYILRRPSRAALREQSICRRDLNEELIGGQCWGVTHSSILKWSSMKALLFISHLLLRSFLACEDRLLFGYLCLPRPFVSAHSHSLPAILYLAIPSHSLPTIHYAAVCIERSSEPWLPIFLLSRYLL